MIGLCRRPKSDPNVSWSFDKKWSIEERASGCVITSERLDLRSSRILREVIEIRSWWTCTCFRILLGPRSHEGLVIRWNCFSGMLWKPRSHSEECWLSQESECNPSETEDPKSTVRELITVCYDSFSVSLFHLKESRLPACGRTSQLLSRWVHLVPVMFDMKTMIGWKSVVSSSNTKF